MRRLKHREMVKQSNSYSEAIKIVEDWADQVRQEMRDENPGVDIAIEYASLSGAYLALVPSLLHQLNEANKRHDQLIEQHNETVDRLIKKHGKFQMEFISKSG